jgi:uncharacterized protein (TIGR02246 family)
MRLILGLVFGLGAVMVQACSPADDEATPDQTADVRLLIERANAELDSAFQNGDADRVAMLFSEDAVWLSNAMVDLPGRDAIGTFTRRFFQIHTVSVFTLTMSELEVYGPTAYDRGTFVWTSISSDQDTTAQRGRYSAVRTRGSDGQWRIHRLLDNTSPADTHPFLRQ